MRKIRKQAIKDYLLFPALTAVRLRRSPRS